MKYIKYTLPVLALFAMLAAVSSCKTNPEEVFTFARTNTFTVNWYRDSTTPNPTAFIDLYNGKSYTMSGAASKPDSIDLFCYDHSALPVSGQNISLINMVFFGQGNYAAASSFQNVVGAQALPRYNASTVSEVTMTTADFTSIRYNRDINSFFISNGLNGGYTDIDIAATDMSNSLKFYQFVCAKTGKRGFFHITSSNYLPGGTMTIEAKVEQ
ncbi:MAG: hypothetical protein JWO03_3694 [Bacteroidetes bacterium]|nr:hypothetical protein [Bacteroidota bacterium]